ARCGGPSPRGRKLPWQAALVKRHSPARPPLPQGVSRLHGVVSRRPRRYGTASYQGGSRGMDRDGRGEKIWRRVIARVSGGLLAVPVVAGFVVLSAGVVVARSLATVVHGIR